MLVPIYGLYAIAVATAVAMILESLMPLWSRTFHQRMASSSIAHAARRVRSRL